jgi:uncharacterized protein (DUF983 family)
MGRAARHVDPTPKRRELGYRTPRRLRRARQRVANPLNFVGCMKAAYKSTLRSMMAQLCPHCRIGKIFRSSIFRGFPKMYDRCPVCGLKFEREQGYFLGAMYISYGLALGMITAFSIVVWSFIRWPLEKDVVVAIIIFVPFAPIVSRLSRVVWIYFDRAVDPE